eukprot:9432123-Pyramimonas_sp.AAC.1
MQQTNAHDYFESVIARISSAAPLQPELRAKTDSTSPDDSNDTNSFADLARAADLLQTSGCKANALTILHSFLCVSAVWLP